MVKKWINWIVKRPLLVILIGSVCFVLFVIGSFLYSNSIVYDLITPSGQAIGRGFTTDVTETMVRYDGFQYTHIAESGYTNTSYTAFFPLYPLLIRMVTALSGLSYQIVGLLLSWVLIIPMAIMIFKWAKLESKKLKIKVNPYLLLGLLAIFPTSFYLALAYTETLFILLTVSALYFYRSERYFVALLFALLSSATRTQGVILCVFFGVDFILNWRANKTFDYRKLVPAVFGVFGLLAYMAFLSVYFGNPLEFLEAQKSWGRLEGNVITNLISSMRPVFLWFILILIVGLKSIWQYLGKAYFVYSLIFILLPVSSGRLDSINRYMLSLIPLFLALAFAASTKPKAIQFGYVALSSFLLAWSIILFANGYWVA